MNILYILLLLLPSLIDCAADELITHAPLRDGMWGTKDYPVEKYQYDKKRLPVLTEHEVMNHFWLQMKDAPQKEKDNALLEIARANIFGRFYLAARKNIAAATWIGADLTKIKTDRETYTENIFMRAVNLNDIPLVSLFFTHKFPVHKESSVFSAAATIDMANLLVQHSARDDIENLKNSYSSSPLLYAIAMGYEPELITFYRAWGFSPMETDSNGHTPLEILFQPPSSPKDLLKGTVFLLTGLTPIEKIILLTKLNRRALYGADTRKVYNKLKKEIPEFTIVQTFLKKTGKQALDSIKSEKCSVCLEPLDPKYHSNNFTSCNHIFHTECLNQSAICPSCKNERCTSFPIHSII